jgi:hypothetical protein
MPFGDKLAAHHGNDAHKQARRSVFCSIWGPCAHGYQPALIPFQTERLNSGPANDTDIVITHITLENMGAVMSLSGMLQHLARRNGLI